MAVENILNNVYFWIVLTFVFLTIGIIMFILLVLLSKKTHAIIEFKAWMKKRPIGIFFSDNKMADWKIVEPEAGMVVDEEYGGFILHKEGTYIDKLTRAVLLPFDSNFGANVNVNASKAAEELGNIVQNPAQLSVLRKAIATNQLVGSENIQALKTTVDIGAIKSMMNAIIPHNVNAKIEKMLASRMQGMQKVNVPQVVLMFAGILGAIIVGYILLKTVGG